MNTQPVGNWRELPYSVKVVLLQNLQERTNTGNMDLFSQYQDDPVGFGEQVLGDSYTDDVKAMFLSVRDNPVTIARSANATGKTHAAARVAVWWYKCFEDCQVYTAAAPPESNLRNLLWGEIGSISEQHPELFTGDDNKSLHISRGAQKYLTGVTIPLSGSESQREAKFSGKHSPHLLFILDEADAIPDEVYKGIESCISGGHARMLIMFNPRAKLGAPSRMEDAGRAHVITLSAFGHPNVISGRDIIPGAVTREATVRRINEWCRPLADDEVQDSECFQLPDFLAGTTAMSHAGVMYPPLRAGVYRIVEPSFSYMVLGQYPTQSHSQLISREWIDAARKRWDAYVAVHGEKAAGPVIAGFDVAEFGVDANRMSFRCENFLERIIGWQGVDIITSGDRGVAECRQRNILRCNADGTGVGSAIAPHMSKSGISAHSVKVAERPTTTSEIGDFKILRDQLWWETREWFRAQDAMIPPDDDLMAELLVPTYIVENGKVRIMNKATMKEHLKRSPDRAESLILTFYKPKLLFPEFE